MPTILITGGHSGIGLECVKELAARGVDIVLAGRDLARLDETAAALRLRCGVKVTTLGMDVSCLGSIREAAAQCRRMIESGEIGRLQAILCNAGATFRGEPSYTKDGYELTFATNYLGHFLLVQLLIDSLEEDGRVVFTASGTHDPDTTDGKFIGRAVKPDAFALAKTGLDGNKRLPGGKRYTTSKLCVVLHAYELDRRLKAAGLRISSIAYDPGAIAATGLLRDVPGPARAMIGSRPVRWLMKRVGLTLGDLVQSGRALAHLAVSSDVLSGRYYQWKDGALHERRSADLTYDQMLAEALWRDSRTLVQLSPEEEPERLK
ncbi:NAD(P)-dependent dehydrogenase, short-chain alcohol dehydrogenase family [Nannocystis exedens]|uniref:NAD(P)-dependent dehydrogenase, short-chain alcohol dehydrogenase family n=2 Tax=Nannocystis exedens TaxID=54 RepID=A0A1I2IW80_9BACT|nr:SDR family NAD(P)-dependent oxidoreductase [Nannocystis exedens]PCC67119.1 Fatty acyl-CoA reductase [Nannocystis exedens]SFF46000.1 NAD(P)-dependent dehydrogenase, short-chain alcohol dehydrogenase family [Nannocystis exedens]